MVGEAPDYGTKSPAQAMPWQGMTVYTSFRRRATGRFQLTRNKSLDIGILKQISCAARRMLISQDWERPDG